MKITHYADTVTTLAELFATARVQSVRKVGGQYVNPQIRLEKATEEYSFSLGRDGKWRFSYHSTYGNGSFIHGEGCDASGMVLPASFENYIEPLGPFVPYVKETS